MATQAPSTQATQTPTNTNIKSAARKLPIKRKPSTQPQSPTPSPSDLAPIPISHHTASPLPDDDDDGFDDDDFDVEKQALQLLQPQQPQPPFKFHRIWSEPDEIRFLQGLLGCWSQGLVFPRDLNVFYDRFSESMPQPYTRNQLSEKLRRLRKKYRSMSARVARGQDPSRLAPHDRDLLHLCSRLWDPKHAAASPFSPSPDPSSSSAGSSGNKRRRPNPRVPTPAVAPIVDDAPLPVAAAPLPAPPPPPAAATANDINPIVVELVREEPDQVAVDVEENPDSAPTSAPAPAAGIINIGKGDGVAYVAAKAVLDVFNGCLAEVRNRSLSDNSNDGKTEMSKRWQEQRLAELDVFASRLRLVLEQFLHN